MCTELSGRWSWLAVTFSLVCCLFWKADSEGTLLLVHSPSVCSSQDEAHLTAGEPGAGSSLCLSLEPAPAASWGVHQEAG